MCAPCVEPARRRAGLSDSNSQTPVGERLNITPVKPILNRSPQVAPQPIQGNVVPVNKGAIVNPQDVDQLREFNAQQAKKDKGSHLALKTTDTSVTPDKAD